jgi:hypothetical protein
MKKVLLTVLFVFLGLLASCSYVNKLREAVLVPTVEQGQETKVVVGGLSYSVEMAKAIDDPSTSYSATRVTVIWRGHNLGKETLPIVSIRDKVLILSDGTIYEPERTFEVEDTINPDMWYQKENTYIFPQKSSEELKGAVFAGRRDGRVYFKIKLNL